MNKSSKLISAARRAARNESRSTGIPYQKCLDLVAVRAGLPTWSAFMADPVPVDDDSREASLEPDFSAIPSDLHFRSIVGHGVRVGATSFTAYSRTEADRPPVLNFVLEGGTSRPVDARGLSLEALLPHCAEATPTVDGMLMRTRMFRSGRAADDVVLSGTFDGSVPARPDIGEPLERFEDRMAWRHPEPGLRGRIRSGIERWRIGRDAQELRHLMQERAVGYEPDSGPAVAVAPDGRLVRLKHGHCMAVFSPPGSGRLAGIVVPMVLTGDASSFVVHDDGQVHSHTSGYRATLGRVAVIRTSGGRTDAVNPLGREWLPRMEGKALRRYLDQVSQALCPHDARVARLVMETAHRLVLRDGGTTVAAVRDAIVADLDGRLAREAVSSLLPLTTPAARAVSETSTVTPADLRGTGTREEPRPFTLYIVRDPLDGGAREPLAAAIQTAIWWGTLDRPSRMLDDGTSTGPCGVATVYLDFHRSTRLPIMSDILTYARSGWDPLVVCGSSASTITTMYGEADGRDILDMFHLRLIPVQSSGREAETIDPRNHVGYGRMRSIPWGRAILAGSPGCTPELDMPLFFRDDTLKSRAHASGCGGPAPVG